MTGPGAGEKPVLLVVDDEESLRSKIVEYLKDEGYAVLDAGTAWEGARLARQYGDRIDLLLLDIVLPDQSGGALGTRILAELAEEPKLLYMSGYDRGELVEAGLIRPHDDLLEKPFELEELSRILARALERD